MPVRQQHTDRVPLDRGSAASRRQIGLGQSSPASPAHRQRAGRPEQRAYIQAPVIALDSTAELHLVKFGSRSPPGRSENGPTIYRKTPAQMAAPRPGE